MRYPGRGTELVTTNTLVGPVRVRDSTGRESEWARRQGIHPHTAFRWFENGTLPVPAERVGPRTILVNIGAVTAAPAVGLGLYARVSSHDQRSDLEREVARLTEWAAKT
ncbi:resolvase, partial [mine drainage metagenome]